MTQISKETKNLILSYQKWQESLQKKEGVSTIHVDEVASKVAAFYEKIRGIIDWKEEHLMKLSVIERSVRKRIIPKLGSKIKVDAESLVLELIRSGHFPNDKIEESKIEEVQKIINKYIYIIESKSENIQLIQWLSSILSCEIEEALMSSIKENALIDFMYNKIKSTTFLSKDLIEKEKITEKEKDIQIFVNIQRALFDLDDSLIGYHLIKYKYPNWSKISEEELKKINIEQIKKEIDYELDHPLKGKISQICYKYNTPYLILNDIILENPFEAENKISNPALMESLIKKHYNKRLNNMQSRMTRAGFYSTLSIFITNIASLLFIEIPVAKYFGQFSNVSYIVDILVPTALMAILVLSIDKPPKGNLEKVIMETIKIVYNDEKKELYEIKKFKKRGPIFNFFISLMYAISFVLSMSVIYWLLSLINFPPFSYIVFVIFLSLIAFAGVKIRERAKELHMMDQKDGFMATITDLLALPIILLGKWFTLRWKKYNIISAAFNALIDMPLSIFVEFIEQWRYFLQEKKERL